MGERSAEQQYLDDNYRIDTISDKRTALILCTSHGTWKDGTFEWENLSKSELIRAHFGKIIFLKDVYRHFYIEGLNPRINKISCIIRMLKENIGEGYRIVTAGFSGGGYLAMVIGSALNAEKVFSFSGIFDIGKWSGSYNDYLVSECDWYKKHLDDIEYSQYFNVLDSIQRSNVKVYHFYSSKNDADNIQIDEITDSGNIIKIAFNSKNHGKTMIGSNIPYLITADENKLEKVARRFRNRLATKYSFSVKLIGLKETIKICIKKLIKKGKS